MEAIQKATFRPLTGGWYRCNQTDDLIKNTKKYAFIYYKKKRNEQLQKEKDKMLKLQTIRSQSFPSYRKKIQDNEEYWSRTLW